MKLAKLARLIFCIWRGHNDACALGVYYQSRQERHLHVCIRCGLTTKDETTPLSAGTMALLADIGMPIEDQQDFMPSFNPRRPKRPTFIN
jgi:hypothetical protein